MKLKLAIQFAAQAHAGQVRKFTGLPYITHPLAVAELVRTYDGNENQVIAAILHDVDEDTAVPLYAINHTFGGDVALMVDHLTKPRKYDLDEDVDFWGLAPPASQLVKLADIVDNTNDVADLDPEFAKVYLPKKARIVANMEGPHMVGALGELWLRAMRQTRA